MADDKASVPSAPAASSTVPSTVPLIDPRDNRIYSVAADKADIYRNAGWGSVTSGPRVNADEIHQSLSGWADNSQAILFTIAKGVPLGVTLGSKVLDANTFQRLAAKAKVFDEDHPIVSTALQLGAGIGTAYAGGAAIRGAGAAASALGFGGEAAAETASAAGLGSEAAAGAGEAAASGVGEAAAASAPGVASEAGAAADTGGSALQRALTSGSRQVPGELGAGEQAAGRLTSGAKQLGDGVTNPIVEDSTGLVRTDQMVPSGAGAEGPIDAEFSELAAPGQLGSAPPLAAPAASVAGEANAAGSAEAGAAAAGEATAASAGEATGSAAASETVNTGSTLSDLLTRAGSRISASKVAKAAGAGALANAAYGQAYKIDNQAIEHALDPQGQEKLMFDANDVLFDAAVGAAIPLGFAGLGKALSKTGKFLTDNSISMFHSAMIKNSSMDQIVQQGRQATLASTLTPYLGKSQEYVFTATKAAVATSEQGMNILKAKYKGLALDGDEKVQIIKDLKRVLGTDKDPIFNDTYAALIKPNVDLLSLQTLAKRLSKRIVWSDPKFAENPINIKYRDARQVIADAQVSLLERGDISMAGDAEQWKKLNQTSSDNQLINDALRSRRGQSGEDVLRGMASSAIAGGLAGGLGANGVGIAASALRSGSWAGVHNIKAQHLAPFAKALGTTMLNVDGKIARTLEAGLYGFPGQAHKLYGGVKYDDAAAAVSLAGQDPAKTLGNLQTHYDAQNIPDEISTPLIQGQAAAITHFAQSIPNRNDAPDMATRDQGDPVQQHRWLDQVRTFQDPTYGLATPTADNMRILKQFYPQTLFNAQQALYTQLAKNPDLPSDARAWASKLLERPVGNLDSPTFAQTLRQARDAQAQAAQQAGGSGKPSGGGAGANGVQSSETRVDALQNRD